MAVKTAVGAADGEEQGPDPIGTVRTEFGRDDYFAVWVKVGRAVVEGYGDNSTIWVSHNWLCIQSSDPTSHGLRHGSDEAVKDFPITGSVPNTSAHTQRQIKIAREGVARRLRRVAQAPSRAIVPRLSDKRRKKGDE